jgi:hypothetical protein
MTSFDHCSGTKFAASVFAVVVSAMKSPVVKAVAMDMVSY